MSNNLVTLVSNFDISKVSFSAPRKNQVGGQSVLLNYSTGDGEKTIPLAIQTPKMRIPFGFSDDVSDTGIHKYSINTSLANKDTTNQNLRQFTEIIHSLDEITKKTGEEKGEEWFGKKHSTEVINEFYKSAEKKSKNDKYPSTLKIKLPTKTTDDKKIMPTFDIYNEQKELVNIVDTSGINLSCLEKGSEVVAIIQCTGVWFVGKTQFGLGWKLVQLKLFRNQKLIGYSIVDNEPDEEEGEGEEVEYVEEDDEN